MSNYKKTGYIQNKNTQTLVTTLVLTLHPPPPLHQPLHLQIPLYTHSLTHLLDLSFFSPNLSIYSASSFYPFNLFSLPWFSTRGQQRGWKQESLPIFMIFSLSLSPATSPMLYLFVTVFIVFLLITLVSLFLPLFFPPWWRGRSCSVLGKLLMALIFRLLWLLLTLLKRMLLVLVVLFIVTSAELLVSRTVESESEFYHVSHLLNYYFFNVLYYSISLPTGLHRIYVFFSFYLYIYFLYYQYYY